MKTTINRSLFITLLLMGVFALQVAMKAQSELEWKTWNDGFPIAVKKKKIALVDTYTSWCYWCKKMDRDTYTDQKVIDKIKEHFVPIKFNPEDKDTKFELEGKQYTGFELLNILSNKQPSGYPTTYFILPGKKILIEVGYQDAASFSQTLDKILAKSEEKN